MKHPTRAKLSVRAERFVAEYLIDLNATQAAIRAGYSRKHADVTGPRLLGHPQIAVAIGLAAHQKLARLEFHAGQVLEAVARIGFADVRQLFDADGRLRAIHELDPQTAAAISAIEVHTRQTPDGDTVTVARVKLVDKLRALELLAKYHGLLKERVEVWVDPARLAALAPDELAEVQRLALAAKRTLETLGATPNRGTR